MQNRLNVKDVTVFFFVQKYEKPVKKHCLGGLASYAELFYCLRTHIPFSATATRAWSPLSLSGWAPGALIDMI
jgi:hypothetical protein